MNGRPVWLASVSLRNPDGIVPNTLWGRPSKRHARNLLEVALAGVGDPTRWRLFRMQVTYCLHRAVSDHELELLPEEWKSMKGSALAGGPVEILDSSGCANRASVEPCDNPRRIPLSELTGVPSHTEAWFPEDCGICPSCRDRKLIEEGLELAS